jgi:hypothetical protein
VYEVDAQRLMLREAERLENREEEWGREDGEDGDEDGDE